METIYALATARGRAGVSVIRISGPLAHDTAFLLTGRALPKPRQAALRRILHKGELLDEGLLLLCEGSLRQIHQVLLLGTASQEIVQP